MSPQSHCPSTRAALLVLLAVAFAPAAWAADPAALNSMPDYHAADPSAPEVTAANLLANERFWPYYVELTQAFTFPDGSRTLEPPLRGVLIRVNANGTVRVDFGRHGMRDLPMAKTDVVAAANRTRAGDELKVGPNLAYAIGPRLFETTREKPHAVVFSRAREFRGFLTVFATLDDPRTVEIAKLTAPLHERGGLAVVAFPQGDVKDVVAWETLRALDWKVFCALDHMSEMYTRTLVPDGATHPYVMLHTAEGRVLYEATWGPGVADALTAAVREHFPPAAD